MWVAMSEDQQALATEARRFLTDSWLADIDPDGARALFKRIANLAWPGVGLPEEVGGSGFSALELGVLIAECGRASAPAPFVLSRIVSEVLFRTTSTAPAPLRRLAAGTATASLAFDSFRAVAYGRSPDVAVFDDGLFGSAIAPGAAVADHLLIMANNPVYGGRPVLVLASLAGPGVELVSDDGLDPGLMSARVTWHGAEPALIPVPEPMWAAVLTLDIAAALLCFEQLGVAEHCLAAAVSYAKERTQFGQPIGSFQAIKHRLADVFTTVELARTACWRAATALDHGEDLSEPALVAFFAATDAADLASREAIHVHGGFGFTAEARLSPHYRRARAGRMLLGSRGACQDRLAATLGWA